MADTLPPVLNLDELFDRSRTIRVVWAGQDYFLRRPEDLGPAEMVAFQRMTEHANALQQATGDMTKAQAEELGRLTAEGLQIICPELAAQGLPFLAQGRVLQFYAAQVQLTVPKAPAPVGRGAPGVASLPGSPSGTGSTRRPRRK